MSIRETFIDAPVVTGNTAIETYDEEIIVIQEAVENLAEANSIAIEIENLNDIAESLENLSTVIASVSEHKTIDLCYIEAATECALTGTGVRTDEVLPNMESYVDDPSQGVEVAMERLGDIIRNIWQTMVKYIRRLWNRVKKFFAGIFKAVPRLKKAAESVKERADKVSGKSAENDSIELGRLAGTLSCDGGVVSSVGKLQDCLKVYDSISEALLVKDVAESVKVGNELVGKIDNVDNPTDERLGELFGVVAYRDSLNNGDAGKIFMHTKKIITDSPNKSKKVTNESERFSQYVSVSAIDLLQSRSLVYRCGMRNLSDNERKSVGGTSKNIASIGLELVMTDTSNSFEMPKEGEVPTFGASDCKNVADAVINLCDYVDKYDSNRGLKEIEKIKVKLEKSTSKKSKVVEKAAEDNNNANLSRNWRSVCNINKQWANDWTTFPQAVWQGHVVTVCRAALDACNRSLSQYK